jgi:hypothetical protein
MPDAPRITVHFDRLDRCYEALDPLAVRYGGEGLAADDPPRAVEHSVLWYTEGKGEEDLGVHFFERVVDPELLPPAVSGARFDVVLPASPLSYEGVIVKVRWCVRVRYFFAGGRDFVSEHEFSVGRVPPAMPITDPAP